MLILAGLLEETLSWRQRVDIGWPIRSRFFSSVPSQVAVAVNEYNTILLSLCREILPSGSSFT